MKKTKLFTSIAALALVLGLGACEVTSEEETTPDESETTTETTDTSESTPTTPSEDPNGYVLVGDFIDSDWDAKVDTSSKYYIPLGTTEYKQTVTIAAEPDYGEWDPWDAGLRVVEWGDSWNLVVGSDELDQTSTGVTGSDGSKNIKVSWGETYDITITFGETNSILVTVHEDSENEGEATPTLFGFEYNGLNYYADGKTTSRGDYAGSVTANIDEAVPVTCSEAEGDNAYYLTFELEGTTYYICIITLNEYENLQYLTTPTPIYWNETYGAWVNAASTHFLAYNATSGYECLWASDISTYISSSPIVGLLDYPTIEGITLSAATQSIYIGRSVTINVTYTPSTIGASNLVWESSNEEVATVTDGVVIGIAVGDVTITATTLNDLTATITLEVVAAPEDEELSIEITPESLAAEYGTDVSQHTDISGNTSTYGGGAVTVAWNKTSGSGDSTGFRPWNSVTTTNNVTTIRIYSGESFTVSSGTGSVSRVVIDAAYGSNNTNNSCGTGTSSFSATNATVGAAVTTDLGDEIEITLNSGAASTTITRSGSVCYCSGITLYYYA